MFSWDTLYYNVCLPLLTSCVPDLKLDLLASQLNCFNFEINPNCGDEGCVECILRKSKNKHFFVVLTCVFTT